jgi:protein SCO1/2
MFTPRRLRGLAAFPLLLILLPTSLRGGAQSTTFGKIKDVVVQTQDGRSVHFYSDLVKGRVVAINFVFTSCTTVCPLMGARFARLQRLLGDRRDVSLISVSIDPATDTPARLAEWRTRMGGKAGWTLVTGAKPDLDALTRSLGAPIADPAAHAPLILIIDDRGGVATQQRLDGVTEAAKVAKILVDVVAK